MVSNGHPSGPRVDGFWNYVPDPSRTALYLLLGVLAFTAAEWVPELAAQMELTRIQERRRTARERELTAYEAWRRKYPHYDRLIDEGILEEVAQASEETSTNFQLAQPSVPMSPMSSEATTPMTWN
jgi:hypothetical protein